MRDLFPEYYELTEDDFKKLWGDCTFAFDANAILNIFRFSAESRSTYLTILNHFNDRLWFPYQAAHEYHRNLRNVIDEQLSKSKNAKDASELNKLIAWAEGFKRHPWISHIELAGKIEEIKTILDKGFEDNFEEYQKQCEKLKVEIALLFDGKVGKSHSEKQSAELTSEARKRYEQARPPGYLDLQEKLKELQDAKTERKYSLIPGNPYGDAIIWLELLSLPSKPKSLVFITDDKKPDWWLIKKNGQTVGPRPELLREMKDAGISFYMYTVDQFMNFASEFVGELNKSEVQEAVREAKELSLPSPETPKAKLFGRSALIGEPAQTQPFLWNGKLIYVPEPLANRALLRNSVRRATARLQDRDDISPPASNDMLSRKHIVALIDHLIDPSRSPSTDDLALAETLADSLADVTVVSEEKQRNELTTRPGDSCFICEQEFGEADPVVVNTHGTPFCPDCAPWIRGGR